MPPCCILALEKRIYLWIRLYERRYKFEVSSQLIYQLNGMQEMVCRKLSRAPHILKAISFMSTQYMTGRFKI